MGRMSYLIENLIPNWEPYQNPLTTWNLGPLISHWEQGSIQSYAK